MLQLHPCCSPAGSLSLQSVRWIPSHNPASLASWISLNSLNISVLLCFSLLQMLTTATLTPGKCCFPALNTSVVRTLTFRVPPPHRHTHTTHLPPFHPLSSCFSTLQTWRVEGVEVVFKSKLKGVVGC